MTNDKTVSISFLIGILFQTGALVWYVSSLASSIDTNARDISRHEQQLQSLTVIIQTQAVTLGRMDENIKSIRDIMEKPTVINHPSVCPGGDRKCQRNLDAQTLSVIGQGEAALKLMCLDADLFDVLDEECQK